MRVSRPVLGGPGGETPPAYSPPQARNWRGNLTVQVKMMKKRLRRSLKRVVEWCRAHRHYDVDWQQATLNVKLRGHCQYHGRPSNYRSLLQFYLGVRRTWKQWLGRRTRGRTLTREKYAKLLNRHPLLRPRITRAWAGTASVT